MRIPNRRRRFYLSPQLKTGAGRFFDNWNSPAEDLNLQPLIFQTQLLKLYFLTTLYVDVKEPALPYVLDDKKTQFHRRLESPRLGGAYQVGTKLSPICSPKCT